MRAFVFLRLLVVASLCGCNLENALNAETGADESTGAGSMGSTSTPTTSTGPMPSDSTDTSSPECGGQRVRVATHNVRSIGAPGSDGYDGLGSTILRIAPDVACFQEVQFEENAALVSLAQAAGYPHAVQAYKSPAIGGGHTNACIGNVPLELVGSWGTQELSSDSGANDTGRDILVVRAAVGEPAGVECYLGVLTVHLKSLEDDVDLFRRQVEVERLRQAIDLYRAMYPGDPIVVMGDFNETLDDPALGRSFTSVPSGLPDSYDLGSDIKLPLQYQPFASLQSEGLSLTDPTQEDSDIDETWGNDEARLDYIWYAGATLVDDEVYNSCRDDGVDEGAPGGMMEKAGDPLACGVSTLVSDHFAVFADLDL